MTENALLLIVHQFWFAALAQYSVAITWIATGCYFLAMVYVLVAAAIRHRAHLRSHPRAHARSHPRASRYPPPFLSDLAFPAARGPIDPLGGVSVLKPLCGVEPRLFENLQTFCEQTIADRTQLLFGVASPNDPAVEVVRKLQEAYPAQDMQLVVNDSVHGTNLKVSNLINIAAHIRHDVVVIADSDIAVSPDYLEKVIAPLQQDENGIVTCLYKARSVGGLWASLGALFIDEWFVPAVSIAHAGGSRRFGFGATLALRRETLAQIGGFVALKDRLADDYWLAEHTRALGLQTVLSSVVVVTDVIETTFEDLWRREMRWLKTIRSLNRTGFGFLFITFTTPWILMGFWLIHCWHMIDVEASTAAVDAGTSMASHMVGNDAHATLSLFIAIAMVAGALARLVLHHQSTSGIRYFWRDLALIPMREMLLSVQWLMATVGPTVRWRGTRISVTGPKVAQVKAMQSNVSPKNMSQPIAGREPRGG